MEKIGWTDHARNEEALRRVKEERNILHVVKRRKANLIVHIFRGNCLLNHVFEGERRKDRSDGKTRKKT
jgi:hypothetical protein